MKNFISTLTGFTCMAALTSIVLADAPGTEVRVKFDEAKLTISELQPPPFMGAKGMSKTPMWFYIDVPMNVDALAKDATKPRSGTIDTLTVTFHLLIKNPNEGASKNSYLKITRPINYVNVPVPALNGPSVVTTHAACFLAPATVRKIAGRDIARAGDLAAYITLVSVDATYNGKPCKESKDKFAYASKILGNDGELRNALKKEPRWWTFDTKRFPVTTDYPLRSIAETPFANQGSGYFPETKPMYGSDPVAPADTASATSED